MLAFVNYVAEKIEPEFLERIRLGHLPARYVWLSRWDKLRKECSDAAAPWPLPESRKQVADDWLSVAKGVDGKPWTKVTLLNEGGLTPEKWAARFANDPVGATRP